MKNHLLKVASVATIALLAACGEGPAVSDVTFDKAREVAMAEGEAFKKEMAGKIVKWSGNVITVKTIFEDDFVQKKLLLLDMDGTGNEEGDADVSMFIPAKLAPTLNPGARVEFTAIMREADRSEGHLILAMEFKDLK